MPRANIDWTKDYRFAPMKAYGGHFFEENPWIFEAGWTTKKVEKMFADFIAEKLPQSFEAFCKEGEHKHPPGFTLVRRASRSVPKSLYKHGNGEIRRFKTPGFRATWNELVKDEKPLMFRHLQELQETGVKLKYKDLKLGSGLYLRSDWEKPKQVYVGMVEHDLLGRNHTNASHFLGCFISTWSDTEARLVESAAHKFLRDIGEPVRRGGKGLFEVKDGNAFNLTLAFLKGHFPSLFCNKNRVIL